MFKPKFTITPKINQFIAEIEKQKTLVDQAKILPELAIQLRFRATVESVHSSTSIEGNPLNEQQVEKVLHGQTITAPDYAIKEVLNYKQALDWLGQLPANDLPLSSEQVKKLHKILMTGLLPKKKVGAWRPGSIYIVNEVDYKEVVQYTGPKATDLPKLVKTFLKWVSFQDKHQNYHPVLLANLIHYIFVSIHPFADGNGRTTRLLTYHYLRSANYDFKQSLSLDTFYLQHRQDYYQALSRGRTFAERMEADLTPFMTFFTKGFLETTKNLARHLQAGKIEAESGKPLRLNQEELQILDYVYQFGSIDVSEAMAALKTSKRTTQRRLINLVEKNILKIEGKGPATEYILKETL